MKDLWFIPVMIGGALVIVAIRVIHDHVVFTYFPCKAGNASHKWTYIGTHHRYCDRCPARQTGREVVPGLGIVAEGETITQWSDVA